MRSSPDPRRLALAALAAGATALGVVAEREGFAWPDTQGWVPDLLAGWTLAALGLAAAALGRSRNAAALLFASGVAWFVGDFHASGPQWLSWLAAHLSWLFLAPLVQLALVYPSGRPRTLAALAPVGGIWIAAATPWVNWNDDTTLAGAMGALALVGIAGSLRAERRRLPDSFAGVGALLLLVVWALAVPPLRTSLQPIAFDAGIALVGAWLFAGLRRSADLAERAIELDESTGTLRGALAELLRDPLLQVGFATDGGGFVDDLGRPVPATVPGRSSTQVAEASGVVGIVVHDPRVLTASGDRDAVSVSVALAARRALLREDLRRRAGEVSRSTVKLIRAGDDERLLLSTRLESSTGRGLHEVARLLDEGRVAAHGDAELDALLERACGKLERARRELAALAGGLGVPALVAGLRPALAELVDGLPLDVELRVADLDCTSESAATIWFVCSEGVANVLKHASASRLLVEVDVGRSGIRVLVEDDGRGGADADGSGLGGLGDRLAALGGSLRVESRPGGGTRLVASLPHPAGVP
jgi:signal transduction histidine kinase